MKYTTSEALAYQFGTNDAGSFVLICRTSGRDIASEFAELGTPLSGKWEDGETAKTIVTRVAAAKHCVELTDADEDAFCAAYTEGFEAVIAACTKRAGVAA